MIRSNIPFIILLSILFIQCSKEKEIDPGKYHVIGYGMAKELEGDYDPYAKLDFSGKSNKGEKNLLGEIIGEYDEHRNSRDFIFEKGGELKVTGYNEITHKLKYKLLNDTTFVLINNNDSINLKIEKLSKDTLIFSKNKYKNWHDFHLELKKVEF